MNNRFCYKIVIKEYTCVIHTPPFVYYDNNRIPFINLKLSTIYIRHAVIRNITLGILRYAAQLYYNNQFSFAAHQPPP